MIFIVQNKVCIWLWKCWRGWVHFAWEMLYCHVNHCSFFFLSLCRLILDEPQLECFWHWGSSDSDTKFSAQVHWHANHILLSNLHQGARSFPPTVLKIWFRAKHILWAAGGRLSLLGELLLWDLFLLLLFIFPIRKAAVYQSSYWKRSRGGRLQEPGP